MGKSKEQAVLTGLEESLQRLHVMMQWRIMGDVIRGREYSQHAAQAAIK